MQRTLPPEWSEQSGIMLTWPYGDSDWADNLVAVEACYATIAEAICRHERLLVVARDGGHESHIRLLLRQHYTDMEQVCFTHADSDDTWARDHGPITILEEGQARLLDFTFNGWGNKYDSRKDNHINQTIQAMFQAPMTTVEMVLEGGSIEVDGQGSLLTTRRCLCSPQRNPDLDQAGIEQQLQQWFGIEQVHWLEHGYLAGDDTDSHIDTLARFCDPHTLVYMHCDDPTDEHYQELQAMAAELEQLRNLQGEPYRLVPMPWPGSLCNAEGKRLPASYVNFLIINDAVLLPIYNVASDAEAIATLQQCFPERTIIAIDCRPLIQQFGSLHCVTMQLPQGVLAHD